MSNPLNNSSGELQQAGAAVWRYPRILWHAAGLAIAAIVPLLVYAFLVANSKREVLVFAAALATTMLVLTCGWLLTTKKRLMRQDQEFGSGQVDLANKSFAQADFQSQSLKVIEDTRKFDSSCLPRIDHRSPWDAPTSIRLVRVLGNGRAATAELVEVTWPDGRRERCVEKVFDPGLLTRVIYRIAFAAPFAYQANRHAILTCFYRRRVAAKLFDRQGSGINVAQPLYVRFDESRRSWVLAAEWIRGRGPIPRFSTAGCSGVSSGDEMSDLIDRMRSAEKSLIDWGLSGSGWQVSPRAMVSTANLLIVPPSPLSMMGLEVNSNVHRSAIRHVIIDLESGIPAVLVARYLRIAWKQGSFFPFDDLDEKRLRSQVLQASSDAYLAEDLERLNFHSRNWKDTELAPLRKPWTWFSRQRISRYRQHCVERWSRCGLTDSASEPLLRNGLSHFALFWLVGCFPLRSASMRLQSLLGNQDYRKKVTRLFWDSNTRRDRISRWQRERLAQWRNQNRISAQSTVGSLTFSLHAVAAETLPAGWHRFLGDPNRRRRRLRQTIGLFIHPHYQSITARRQFSKVLRRWQSRQWVDQVEADQLRSHLNGPRIAVYSRGMAMHLGIKSLYPFFAPLKLGGAAMLLGGGNVWLGVAPFAILPALRTMVTLTSRWTCRGKNVPHGIALAVGVLPTLGSSAFLVQTWSADREVFAVWAREIAAALGRRLPVYGGADSRTEHAFLSIVDRILVKPTAATRARVGELKSSTDRRAA